MTLDLFNGSMVLKNSTGGTVRKHHEENPMNGLEQGIQLLGSAVNRFFDGCEDALDIGCGIVAHLRVQCVTDAVLASAADGQWVDVDYGELLIGGGSGDVQDE